MSLSSELRSWALASAGVFALSAIGYKALKTPSLPDLKPAVANLNAATAEWSKASAQQAASVVQIERDIRVELWQVDRLLVKGSGTLSVAQGAIGTLNAQLTHIGPLLDSARAATDAVPVTLQHVNGVVDGLTPVLASTDAAVGDFRRFLTAPELLGTLRNVDSMTGSWAAVSGDLQKVADKTSADYLKPVPWYLWPVKRGGELLDIGAAIARHTP